MTFCNHIQFTPVLEGDYGNCAMWIVPNYMENSGATSTCRFTIEGLFLANIWINGECVHAALHRFMTVLYI
jgi:hypothetical protein